jgi:hypothetical protein
MHECLAIKLAMGRIATDKMKKNSPYNDDFQTPSNQVKHGVLKT